MVEGIYLFACADHGVHSPLDRRTRSLSTAELRVSTMVTPVHPKRMLLDIGSISEDPASKAPRRSRGNVYFCVRRTMVYGFLARRTRQLSTADLRVGNVRPHLDV